MSLGPERRETDRRLSVACGWLCGGSLGRGPQGGPRSTELHVMYVQLLCARMLVYTCGAHEYVGNTCM